MSRRVHACLTCSGKTRHRGPCAACRRRGVRLAGDELLVPLELEVPRVRVAILPAIADVRAPTVREISEAGIDITPLLAWHGTDCPCTACARDRIPGRYA